MWLVQAVGFDADGQVDRVKWQKADPATNKWVGDPRVVPVIEVVDELMKARVATFFDMGRLTANTGPYLRTRVLAGGIETIETDNDQSPGDYRTLSDLPKL